MTGTPPTRRTSAIAARTTSGWVVIACSEVAAMRRLGLRKTLSPGRTSDSSPPRASNAFRTEAATRSRSYEGQRWTATTAGIESSKRCGPAFKATRCRIVIPAVPLCNTLLLWTRWAA